MDTFHLQFILCLTCSNQTLLTKFMQISMLWRKVRWFHILFLVLASIFYTEFAIFHLAVMKCQWPCSNEGCAKSDLKAFMISDTHLLGKRKGHWLDKLKREWNMYRSYRSAVSVHDPDAVFFLGDLLDEGQWAGNDLFKAYADNFRNLFGDVSLNKTRPRIYALAGNHDLGFHYVISPLTMKLFEKEFKRSSIDEIFVKGHRFVLITSMALHGDGCRLCQEAEEKLENIVKNSKHKEKQPIVLQHFPMYRKDDSQCEKIDDIDLIEKEEVYRERWETISIEASMKIIDKLKPRAVFGGHTHKICKKQWNSEYSNFFEYTVNSFSWRNGDRPAFLMVVVNNEKVSVSFCRLPSESFQILVYSITGLIVLLWILINCLLVLTKFLRRTSHKTPYIMKHE